MKALCKSDCDFTITLQSISDSLNDISCKMSLRNQYNALSPRPAASLAFVAHMTRNTEQIHREKPCKLAIGGAFVSRCEVTCMGEEALKKASGFVSNLNSKFNVPEVGSSQIHASTSEKAVIFGPIDVYRCV